MAAFENLMCILTWMSLYIIHSTLCSHPIMDFCFVFACILLWEIHEHARVPLQLCVSLCCWLSDTGSLNLLTTWFIFSVWIIHFYPSYVTHSKGHTIFRNLVCKKKKLLAKTLCCKMGTTKYFYHESKHD